MVTTTGQAGTGQTTVGASNVTATMFKGPKCFVVVVLLRDEQSGRSRNGSKHAKSEH